MTPRRSESQTRAIEGAGFVLAGAAFVQSSAAVVTPLFGFIGPAAAAGWRFLLGAVVLLALTRPQVRTWTHHQWLATLALGLSTACMGECFYQSIQRIPLGSSVAIEYLGPFLVAALSRRSLRHFSFVALAGIGVVALAHPGGGLTLVGVVFAAGSGAFWAIYAFANHRVGGVTSGFGGLAVSMAIAAVVTLPWSLGSVHRFVAHPDAFGRMLVVAVLWTVCGIGAEMQALRRLSPGIVSVLLALDPAVAFAVGWLLLSQAVTVWDLVGLACVITAGVGVTHDAAGGLAEVAR